MSKKETTLNDIAGVKDELTFTVAEMKEFHMKLTEKFGFTRAGINKFHEKAGFAEVIWEMKQVDGTVVPLPMGKIKTVYFHEELRGKTIWKNYDLKVSPFEFYEELFRQTNAHVSKMEYGAKMRMQQLAGLEATIGEEIHE